MIHHPLKEKIGQLFLIGFEGATLSKNHPVAIDITKRNLGGVILFDRLLAKNLTTNNIVSLPQVTELTSTLQDLAQGNLLIAVDQEGGMVARLKEQHGFPATPSAEILGKEIAMKETARYSHLVANTLSSLGINFNLAPVVDLNINKKNPVIGGCGRSFAEDPQTVFENARLWVEAHHKAGLLSCLKHFPGHGSSVHDSHLGFVDISTTWDKTELHPFREFIAAGYQEAVMIGHLFNRNLDELHPAPLSYPIIHGILREQLGHSGVIVSDDMQMKAITDHYGLAEACCRAISAGVDLLIIGNNLCHDPQILEKVQNEIIKALKDGRLTEKRIEEAWSRIQHFKLLRNLKNV